MRFVVFILSLLATTISAEPDLELLKSHDEKNAFCTGTSKLIAPTANDSQAPGLYAGRCGNVTIPAALWDAEGITDAILKRGPDRPSLSGFVGTVVPEDVGYGEPFDVRAELDKFYGEDTRYLCEFDGYDTYCSDDYATNVVLILGRDIDQIRVMLDGDEQQFLISNHTSPAGEFVDSGRYLKQVRRNSMTMSPYNGQPTGCYVSFSHQKGTGNVVDHTCYKTSRNVFLTSLDETLPQQQEPCTLDLEWSRLFGGVPDGRAGFDSQRDGEHYNVNWYFSPDDVHKYKGNVIAGSGTIVKTDTLFHAMSPRGYGFKIVIDWWE